MSLDHLKIRPMSIEQKISKIAQYKIQYGSAISYKKKIIAKEELKRLKGY